MQSSLLTLLFAAAVAGSVTVNAAPERSYRLCGMRMVNTISAICRSGCVLPFGVDEDEFQRARRSPRSLSEECCASRCSYAKLAAFCCSAGEEARPAGSDEDFFGEDAIPRLHIPITRHHAPKPKEHHHDKLRMLESNRAHARNQEQKLLEDDGDFFK